MSLRRVALIILTPMALVVACGDEPTTAPSSGGSVGTQGTGGSTPATDAVATAPVETTPAIALVAAGEPFPADRCEANKGAGTITYLSSFDYAASASIVEVLVAEAEGLLRRSVPRRRTSSPASPPTTTR